MTDGPKPAHVMRELKLKYKQMSEVQLSKLIQMVQGELKTQKTASLYLSEQLKQQESILLQLSMQREKDKIQAAESKMRIQGVRKRYEFALRSHHMTAKAGPKVDDEVDPDATDDEDNEGDPAENEMTANMAKGESRVYFENHPMPMSIIRKWGTEQLMSILDEHTERLAQTNDQIINIFKGTDLRMRLFGLPLEEQKVIEANPDDSDDDETENAVKSQAVYVRVFASDFLPFTGDDRSQLSRMFGNTFSISAKTTLADIQYHACKFWGVLPHEFSLWLENPDAENGIDLVEPEEMLWKTNALPDLAANEGDDAVLFTEIDPGKPVGQYQTFYLGRVKVAAAKNKQEKLKQQEKQKQIFGYATELRDRDPDMEDDNNDLSDLSAMQLYDPSAAVAGLDPFDGVSELDNFRTKMKAKRKYDQEMFEILKLKRQAKMQFTTAATTDSSSKDAAAGDEAQSKKMKTTIEFLRRYLTSYIDSLVRIKNEKDAREKRMSSHCCRVTANVFMLLVLAIWSPMTHNSQAEYFLSQKFRQALDQGFSKVESLTDWQKWTLDSTVALFYPSEEVDEGIAYEPITEVQSYAKYYYTKVEGSTPRPELFVVGKVCWVSHRLDLGKCPSRGISSPEFDQECRRGFMKQDEKNTNDIERSQDYEWVKYRRQSEDQRYGGNIVPSYWLSGFHGQYYLTEGYYTCFNPYQPGGAQNLRETYVKLPVIEIFTDDLRSFIFTGQAFHPETQYFINWQVVFEKDAHGQLSATRNEVEVFRFFGMQSKEKLAKFDFFIALRLLLIIWIILNSFATFRRARSLNEFFSPQSLYGMYNSFLIIIFQSISVDACLNLRQSPFDIRDLNTPKVRETFWMMSTLARDFRRMVYMDSICVFLCVANVIMHFRRLAGFINLWLNALQTSAGVLVVWLIFWVSSFIGLASFNIALYGSSDIKYRDFFSSLLYTIYSPSQLQWDIVDDIHSTHKDAMMPFVNTIFFYFINLVLMLGPYMALAVQEHVFCEMTNFEPAVDRDGNYVHETVEKPGVKEQIKRGGITFILWFVSWLPAERVYKLKLNLLGDEALE